jgi:alkanesulfonate monooxygenase SsuD/methylene tetrahydromethanopterin reductase-like flavin-dependent oxidoreductase (luciferase family)
VTRPLRIGIQLPEVEREVRWAEYVDLARTAEEVGFDSIWLGDHLLYRGENGHERGPWEVWTMLAALAGATERVTLGPLVACTAFHPPAVLAKMAATVDEISGGRLVLGLGAGWNETEFRSFGLRYDQRVARFAEAFAVIAPLVRGERATLAGQFSSVDEAVLLPASARATERPLPLMIGSTGERMLELTLGTVEMWNTWFTEFGNTPEGFAVLNRRVSAIAERVGRPAAEIDRSACVLVVVDPASRERRVPEGCTPLAGDPATVAAAMHAYAAAGADEVILVANPIDHESIRALGRALALLDD